MSIQEWGAIGEIVGGIAVVASLVYLAMQIRQNTRQLSMTVKATELAAFERNVEAGNRIREMLITNPDVAELFARGLKSYERLAASDKLRFDMVIRNVFSGMQGAYIRQLTYGTDPLDFAGSTRMLDQILGRRGVREWLSQNEADWRPEFAALVDERLRSLDGN